MRFVLFISILGFAGFALAETIFDTLQLDAKMLYQGFRLEKIVPVVDSAELTVDTTNQKTKCEGLLETDALDPADPKNNTILPSFTYGHFTVVVAGTVPEGTQVELLTRTGNSFYSDKKWTTWEKAKSLTAVIKGCGNTRFLQVRLILKGHDKTTLPIVRSLSVIGERTAVLKFQKELSLVSFQNETFVTSAVPYEWERTDAPIVEKFMKQTSYANAFAKPGTEWEKLVALNTAIARTHNYEHEGWSKNYPWSVYDLGKFTESGYAIKGHCMSYAALLVTVLTGLNRYSRHWAVSGFRDRDHEVVDVWVDSLRKWVYFDPSLSEYYLNPVTKEPLSLMENHAIFVKTFLKEGESSASVPMQQLKDRVKAYGGGKKAPIICVDSGWHYGAPNPNYDWGWETGFMTDGFLRVTTRNNFNSKKEPWFAHFGDGINFNSFLHFVDGNSPPRSDSITAFSRRPRDFYPTLNQAAFKIHRTKEDQLELELGNTQPFFKKYAIEIGGHNTILGGPTFIWKLKKSPDVQALKVTPLDEWGKEGIASSVSVKIY